MPTRLAKRAHRRCADQGRAARRRRDRVRGLSGGNRRKVELVRAFTTLSPLIMMDEPTFGLDPGSRHALLQEVLELCHERGVGVLWATHLVEEAERADRVIIMHRGLKLTEGPPEKTRC
ncbi:MAG: ATP-binding cassette domain-containing protein [Burkholderiaceae bacterium]